MQYINIDYDSELFIVQVNGKSPSISSTGDISVLAGDLLRITTTYKRNWFVNGKPIGLQDEIDDAMYQNVYTLIPENTGKTDILSVGLAKGKGSLDGDVFPYSVADAAISCPLGWHFFESPSEIFRVTKKSFNEKEILWDLGEFIRSLKLSEYTYKTLPTSRDYFDKVGLCGVVKEDDMYCFVHQGEYTLDSEPMDSFERKYFDSLSELADTIKSELMGLNN